MHTINQLFIALSYIGQNILNEIGTEDLSLDTLTALCSCSKTQLNRIFQTYLGDTPMKYIYRQKLKHSLILLEGSQTILDIAVMIGFQSHEGYTRAFKKEFGLTPKQYRTMYQNGLQNMQKLSDLELIMLYTTPSDICQNEKYYSILKSLVEKGYFTKDNSGFICTIDGKQLTDKYFWDCSNVIIRLADQYSTLAKLYENTKKIIHMPKLLFYMFAYELVEIGKMRNLFIGSCGWNCFTCGALTHNIKNNETDDICFGCTSDVRLPSCHKNCPWRPCCTKHNIIRCNTCNQFPCKELSEMYLHYPEYEDNFNQLE